MYKCETHCHTKEVSTCSRIPYTELIDKLIEYKYTTVVITDHFNSCTFERVKNLQYCHDKIEHYLSGYKSAKKYANGKINVLLGMEFRNIYSNNDYLCYGDIENFINKYNKDDLVFLKTHLKDFVRLAHENNVIVFQAHPFRDGMEITNPDYIDGIEISNCHPRHESRNDIARLWAEKYNLNYTGGSDIHQPGDAGRGGILTDFPIKCNNDLVNALISRPQLILPNNLH